MPKSGTLHIFQDLQTRSFSSDPLSFVLSISREKSREIIVLFQRSLVCYNKFLEGDALKVYLFYLGKYWKTLPREQRETWEAKAIVAQAEHKKKYPDWRFRPGANALAKVKDGPRKKNRKGRGEAEKEERSREKRCDKIADLLVAGKTGNALQAAIEAYDCEAGTKKVKEEGGGVVVMQVQEQVTSSPKNADVPRPQLPSVRRGTLTNDQASIIHNNNRSHTPEAYHDGHSKIPLTSMFKRSSSAPASQCRNDVLPAWTGSLPCAANVPSPPVELPSSPALSENPNPVSLDQAHVVGDITTFLTTSTSTRNEEIENVNRLVTSASSVPGMPTSIAGSTFIGGAESNILASEVSQVSWF